MRQHTIFAQGLRLYTFSHASLRNPPELEGMNANLDGSLIQGSLDVCSIPQVDLAIHLLPSQLLKLCCNGIRPGFLLPHPFTVNFLPRRSHHLQKGDEG